MSVTNVRTINRLTINLNVLDDHVEIYNFGSRLSSRFTLANTTAPDAYFDSTHTANNGYQQAELNINTIQTLPMIMQV